MLIEKRQGTSVVQRQGRAPLGLGWRMLEMALNQVCGCRCRLPLSVVPGGGPGLDGMGVPSSSVQVAIPESSGEGAGASRADPALPLCSGVVGVTGRCCLNTLAQGHVEQVCSDTSPQASVPSPGLPTDPWLAWPLCCPCFVLTASQGKESVGRNSL